MELAPLGLHDEERVEALVAGGRLETGAGDVDRGVGECSLPARAWFRAMALLRGGVQETSP